MGRRGNALCVMVVAVTCAIAQPQADYEETVRRADALFQAGDYMDAVRIYERAARIAYNNKLTTDTRALNEKLALARKARDEKPKSAAPAAAAPVASATPSFVELATKLACGPRILNRWSVPLDQQFGPTGSDSSWVVTNPYLPVDRKFFQKVYEMACASDGTLYVAAESRVSAAETGRPPTTNKGFYADNGAGIWRVAPSGAVTTFSVRPSGNLPGWDRIASRCNARITDAGISPEHWGGMTVDPAGNLVVSENELNLILRFKPDGMVELVAGGGADACGYDRWKTPQKSGYSDGRGSQALFNGPAGLAFDHEGNLLVADAGNCALRRIDKDGIVTTIHKGCSGNVTNPTDESTRIRYERVIVDREGRPVVGGPRVLMGREIYANIFRFSPDGRVEQLLAGRRLQPRSPQQQVGLLTDFTMLPGGALLISDGYEEGSRVDEVRNGLVFNFVGVGGSEPVGSDVDGPAAKARIRQPGGLCASGDGTVFVRPRSAGRPLRRIDPRTRTVSTWVY